MMKSKTVLAVWCLVFFSALVAGCSSSNSGGSAPGGKSVKLQGSGASFPAPLYTRWFQEYSKATPGVTIDFQAKGSGAGIKDFINKTVDFGASDAAMEPDEIAQVDGGVVLLPMTAGKVVLAYNLPGGPPELKLSREAYTKILMGQITKWNDPLIVACNDGFAMPATDITVVVRSDSSGTTYVFAQHLSAVSQEWADEYGTNKTINWPSSDKFVKGPKNDGVTALIKQTPGSIGYIEYGFAMQTGQSMATLENKAGKYVKPTLASGTAALANAADMPEDLIVWLPDPDGDDSYPIVSYTWLLCYKSYADPQKTAALKGVVQHCLTEGQNISGDLGYIPLPENVVQVVQQALDGIE
jgi:phosphate transport system substrate-binding protein